MEKVIYYIIDLLEHKFYFFETYKEALEKEKEFGYKYLVNHKTLKKFYGTIWYAFKFTKTNACHHVIQSQWKLIKINKDFGYTIKKKILYPYNKSNLDTRSKEQRKQDIEDARGIIG